MRQIAEIATVTKVYLDIEKQRVTRDRTTTFRNVFDWLVECEYLGCGQQ
jgi:hypothetical protein